MRDATHSKTPPNRRVAKWPRTKILHTMTAKLANVVGPVSDKNGNLMKYGWTSEFIKNGVFYAGKIVSCREEALFEAFVPGLLIDLESL